MNLGDDEKRNEIRRILIYHRHGKDNKLIIWKLPPSDEDSMSKVLPVDTVSEERRKPWVLHMLDVNTMNFCAFAKCSLNTEVVSLGLEEERDEEEGKDSGQEGEKEEVGKEKELLIAVPNTLTSESVCFPSL